MKEDFLKTETFTVTVPMREDMPRSVKEAVEDHARLCAESDEKYKAALNDPSLTPAQMKRVIDDWYKSHYNRSMATTICGFDDEAEDSIHNNQILKQWQKKIEREKGGAVLRLKDLIK